LGVSGVSLGEWKRAAIRQGDHPDPNYKGPKIDYHVLQEENLRLKQENEILWACLEKTDSKNESFS
jgi:hypothetical protein